MGIQAILRYECKKQCVSWKLALAVGCQVVVFGCAFLLMRAAQLGKLLDVLLFAQMWLVLLAAPIFAIIGREPTHGETPVHPFGIALSKWLGCSIQAVIFWVFTLLVLVGAFGWRGAELLYILVKSHSLFLVLLLFGALLGLLCGFVCRQATHAVQLSYLIIGLLITDVFWFPPLVQQNIGSWTPLLLHLNPFVALSAILHVDLFRTPYLYEVSRISSYSYVYPAWYWTVLWYSLGVGVCLLLVCWRIHVARPDTWKRLHA